MTEPGFPPGFLDRVDDGDDAAFYRLPRFVLHLDQDAVRAVGALYDELGLTGRVLDLCSSWVSHLRTPPQELVVLGLNADELAANPMATERVVHDLNADPVLPFPDGRFDAVTCCASVDYLVRPVTVLTQARRVLRPGGVVAVTWSDRCFPSKAVRGWLGTDDAGRLRIVQDYLRRAGFQDVRGQRRTPVGHRGDPVLAVCATAPPPAPAG